MDEESPELLPLRQFLERYGSVDNFASKTFELLKSSTRLSLGLPLGFDFDHYERMGLSSSDVQNAALKLLDRFPCASLGNTDAAAFSGTQDKEEQFERVTDLSDAYIEQIDILLGNKAKTDHSKVAPRADRLMSAASSGYSSAAIPKPQLKFEDRIDNFGLFRPKLASKPNAKVPLDPSLQQPSTVPQTNPHKESPQISPEVEGHLSGLGVGAGARAPSADVPHPYAYEIENIEYLSRHKEASKEILYRPIDETPCTWVDSPSQLRQMLDILKTQTEIAVDLENHSFRSFQGFLCLMQVSTREEDFLVDTLTLRSELHILNEVFTNPSIVKVLHGADMDIVWLQRDLGLYVVNMFDTGQASRVLEFPSAALSYVLKHFCDVHANKKYQLADWRIRPLTPELLKYAREDTHYLLYIYDRLKNELVHKGNETNNLMNAVLRRSERICLKRYTNDPIDLAAAASLCERFKITVSETQLRVIQQLYAWRDRVAREEDESCGYVMPNATLFNLGQSMPTTDAQLRACQNSLPPLMRTHQSDLLRIISEAKEAVSSLAPATLPTATQPTTTSGLAPLSLSASNEVSSPARGRSGESPVMTTAQLYRHAGWVNASSDAADASEEQAGESAKGLRAEGEHPEDRGAGAATTEVASSGGPSGADAHAHGGLAAFLNENFMEESPAPVSEISVQSSSALFPSGLTQNKPVLRSEMLQIDFQSPAACNVARPTPIRAAASSPATPTTTAQAALLQSPPPSIHGQKVSSLLGPPQPYTLAGNGVSRNKVSDTSLSVKVSSLPAGAVDSSGAASSSTPSAREPMRYSSAAALFQTPARASPTDSLSPTPSPSPVADGRLPTSAAEIYQLANKNKKRKKRRLKGEQGSGSFVCVGDDENDDGSAAADDHCHSAKPAASSWNDESTGNTNEDDVGFMRRIGWMGNAESSAGAAGAHVASGAASPLHDSVTRCAEGVKARDGSYDHASRKRATPDSDGEARASGRAPPEVLHPFDYSAASQAAGYAAVMQAANVHGRGNGSQAAAPEGAFFDNHKNVEEVKFGKLPRKNTRPRAGQRSMTFHHDSKR